MAQTPDAPSELIDWFERCMHQTAAIELIGWFVRICLALLYCKYFFKLILHPHGVFIICITCFHEKWIRSLQLILLKMVCQMNGRWRLMKSRSWMMIVCCWIYRRSLCRNLLWQNHLHTSCFAPEKPWGHVVFWPFFYAVPLLYHCCSVAPHLAPPRTRTCKLILTGLTTGHLGT